MCTVLSPPVFKTAQDESPSYTEDIRAIVSVGFLIRERNIKPLYTVLEIN